jgi:hypothetical protein
MVNETLCKLKVGLIGHFTALGARTVEIEYDGCGDEGAVRAICCRDLDGNAMILKISEELTDLIDKYMAVAIEYDWYNNEGGYGTILIDVENGAFSHECNVRIEEIDRYAWEDKLDGDLEGA